MRTPQFSRFLIFVALAATLNLSSALPVPVQVSNNNLRRADDSLPSPPPVPEVPDVPAVPSVPPVPTPESDIVPTPSSTPSSVPEQSNNNGQDDDDYNLTPSSTPLKPVVSQSPVAEEPSSSLAPSATPSNVDDNDNDSDLSSPVAKPSETPSGSPLNENDDESSPLSSLSPSPSPSAPSGNQEGEQPASSPSAPSLDDENQETPSSSADAAPTPSDTSALDEQPEQEQNPESESPCDEENNDTTPTSTSSSASPADSTPSSSPTSSDPEAQADAVVAGYFTDWTSDKFSPDKVDFSKFNHLFFAFGIPNQQGGIDFDTPSAPDLLKQLATNAHQSNGKVILSVGGWTGSKYFSTIVADESSRNTFAQNLVNAVKENDIDGVDLDWEYPGNPNGAPGNAVSPQDSANLLELLKSLRESLGSDKLLTMATNLQPFIGEDGSPMPDVSSYADYLDFITLMNYDVNQASANPGPNAPLKACDGAGGLSGQSALDAWTSAKFPADQLVLGVPFYGYVSESSATTYSQEEQSFGSTSQQGISNQGGANHEKAFGEADTNDHPFDAYSDEDNHVQAGDGNLDSYKGAQTSFRILVESGALTKQGDNFEASAGYTRDFDDCSQTPFIYKTSANTFVSYDDPQSMKAKGKFAADNKMKGVTAWSVDGDTDEHDLVNALISGLGGQS